MTYFRPVFPLEKNIPVHLAQWLPKLQWTRRSHYFFMYLSTECSEHDLHLFHLSNARCQGDMVQGGDWGKHLPKRKTDCLLPVLLPLSAHHRATRWVPEPAQGRVMEWESRTQCSPPPSDENTAAQRYLAHPTDVGYPRDVHVPRSAAVPDLGDVGSWGRHTSPPAQVCGGHLQVCPWWSSKGALPTANIFW